MRSVNCVVVVMLGIMAIAGCSGSGPTRTAELRGFRLDRAEKQQEADWCWAACVVMIFDAKAIKKPDGTRFEQSEVVGRFKTGALSQAANEWEITCALGADTAEEWFRQQRNQRIDLSGRSQFDAAVKFFRIDYDMMVDYLQKNDPTIVCFKRGVGSTEGHACVVTAIEFLSVSDGKSFISMENLDPRNWEILKQYQTVVPEVLRGSEVEKMVSAPPKYEVRRVQVFDPATGLTEWRDADAVKSDLQFVMGRRKAAAIIKDLTALTSDRR